MTRDELQKVLDLALDEASSDRSRLVDLLLPFFSGLDFQSKSLFVRIPTDNLPPDTLNRLYAYADWIRHLGARNVVFLPSNAEVSVLELTQDKYFKLKFANSLPDRAEVDQILDWLRIAGADPEKIVVMGPDAELE